MVTNELFDLEEELVLFFADNIDKFNNMRHMSHHNFFQQLSKAGFDVSSYDSLVILETLKSLKQKNYLTYSNINNNFILSSFKINHNKCLSYLSWYKRNRSFYGRFVNHLSIHSWFYGSLFGALVGSIFTVLIEKLFF